MRISYTAHSVIATVIPPASSTMLSVLPGSPVANQSAMLTASVSASSGTPAGTVEFQNDGVAIPDCSGQPLTEAIAVCSTELSAASSPERLTAVFHPGPGVNPKESVSNTEDVTVGKGSTTTTLHATEPAGDSVTYTANVTPGRALLKADHGMLNANLTIVESSAGSASTQHASVHLVEQRAAKAKKPKKQ